MLDYKDILNKHYVIRLSAREISRQTGMSKSGAVSYTHLDVYKRQNGYDRNQLMILKIHLQLIHQAILLYCICYYPE